MDGEKETGNGGKKYKGVNVREINASI